MTFSQEVKNEIIRSARTAKGCCATAFLRAVVKSCGSLALSAQGFSFAIAGDNLDLLNLCSYLAYSQLSVTADVEKEKVNAKGSFVYSCEFSPDLGEKLSLVCRDVEGSLLLVDDAASLMPSKTCCRQRFMQGLFVACGSVVIPSAEDDDVSANANYHLELRFTDSDFACAVAENYAFFGFHSTKRKNYTVLYLKDSEKIADFFVYVSAMSSKLKLENVIVMRSVRNTVNRQSNCITANIGKSVEACGQQLEAIRRIRKKGLFDSMPEPLKQIAVAREENPEATLSDIASKLKISKSGANHRFEKLKDWADK